MGSKKKPRRHGCRSPSIMGRSDIPYAQRMAMQHSNDIRTSRDHAAKIALYCMSVAMNEVEGIGYKRLVRFSLKYKDVVDEFYEDPDVGMAHARQYLAEIGMPISGEFFTAKWEAKSRRQGQVRDHALQASQIALLCGTIAMHMEFGFAASRQERISNRVSELTGRYAKEGEGFLLEKMGKIGFRIVGSQAIACMEDDGTPVLPKNWSEGVI